MRRRIFAIFAINFGTALVATAVALHHGVVDRARIPWNLTYHCDDLLQTSLCFQFYDALEGDWRGLQLWLDFDRSRFVVVIVLLITIGWAFVAGAGASLAPPLRRPWMLPVAVAALAVAGTVATLIVIG